MRISDWSSDVCSSDLKPVPQFDLSGEIAGRPGLDAGDLKTGRPVLVNVFASWCIPCVAEAPQLLAMKRQGAVIQAIAIRDTGEAVTRFLERHGDPFARIGFDPESRVQRAFGSGGVPETFVVAGKGVKRGRAWGRGRGWKV